MNTIRRSFKKKKKSDSLSLFSGRLAKINFNFDDHELTMRWDRDWDEIKLSIYDVSLNYAFVFSFFFLFFFKCWETLPLIFCHESFQWWHQSKVFKFFGPKDIMNVCWEWTWPTFNFFFFFVWNIMKFFTN